jgi:uncharacterized protein (TIGR04255 family)
VSGDVLPDYDNPPINEVVLGVQADTLKLTTPLIGLFWTLSRDVYPEFQVHPALDPVIELFGEEMPRTIGPGSRVPALRLLAQPETPRCWFIEESGSRLVQIQQDRLICNWRRVSNDERYPRYSAVREMFVGEYARLEGFLVREPLGGHLEPNWCEVSYVNHLVPTPQWRLGELGKVFSILAQRQLAFLPPAEEGSFEFKFLIPDADGKPNGRLHVSAKEAVRRKDGARLLILELTARGRPEGERLDGVLRFMDRAHEWIVRGFTDVTSPLMHELWGRRA